ncbi:alpha/beta fold hydrolase [Phenylobacterium sp.]|uniref:alpha/beta fold hydrolase n=1 Tax=Phenylobacterium sp. TaxID=1871053 RepID=UPI00286A3FAF|nr:alpha/beta fold hydrolase [Phenylobacterium sp.]
MRNYVVETREGRSVFTADTPSPNVLLFHGFKRRADQLISWRERIPGLGFVHLPGHSGAPDFSETTLAAWVRGLGEMIAVLPRPPLILAESLGAIVAMALPYRALIAVEPPLSVRQLWPLHRTIRQARARGTEIDPALERMFEAPFHWALDRIQAPTLVLAGLEPLLPERDVSPEPSLLTDEDFAAYARHPFVEAHRIAGGHTLLDHNPEGVMATSRAFMLRHGYLSSP